MSPLRFTLHATIYCTVFGQISSVGVCQTAQYPIAAYVKDSDSNSRRFEISIYDKVEMRNGSVWLVHLNWSEERGRPARLFAIERLHFSLYRGQDSAPKGKVGIATGEVKKITYWEEMAVNRFLELVAARQFTEALQLRKTLTEINPHWPLLSANLKLAKALVQSGNRKAVDQGLALLHELAVSDRLATGVEEAFTSAYLNLATQAFHDHQYEEGHDYLKKVDSVYPFSARVDKFQAGLRAQAGVMLKKAKQLETDGNIRAALDLAAKTRRFVPQDTRVVEAHERYLRRYQIVRIACYEDAGAFDPFNASRSLERQISHLVFDSLFSGDESGRGFFRTPLVERFESKALGTEFEFQLNPNIRFADGSTLLAQDVATTVALLKNPRAEAFDPEWAGFVRGVRVHDPFRFTVMLRQYPRPPALLTFHIASSKLTTVPQRGQPASRFPLGTGPFVLSNAKNLGAGDTKLTANPRFRAAQRGLPYVKEMYFHRYTKKGTGTAVNDLERGKTHVITDPSPLQLMRLQNTTHRFSSRPFLTDSVWCLVFNHRKKVFQDRDLRRAVRLAIDRKHILKQYFVQGVVGASHTVITGPFPPQSSAYCRTVKMEQPAPDIARSLVAKSKRREISLKYPSGDMNIELAVLQIKKDLNAVGLKVRTKAKLPNDLMQEVALDHDFDMAYWRIDHKNILFNLASIFDVRGKALARGGTNYMGYDDDELTQLFSDLRREQTGDKIWRIQNRIHMHLHKNVVLVPLWWLESFVVHTTRLVGKTPDGKSMDLPLSRRNLFRNAETWYLEPKK